MFATRLFSSALLCVLLVLTGRTAVATTYTVDIQGSGQFTDIPPAIAAARDGDVLVVLSGAYSSFTLTKNLTILGIGNVSTHTNSTARIDITNVPVGRVAIVNVLTTHITITSCPGHVFIQDYSPLGSVIQTLDVDHCADVRIRGVQILGPAIGATGGAVKITNSRVEFVRTDIQGRFGTPGDVPLPAIVGNVGARMHAVLTNITGGTGIPSSTVMGGPGAYAVNLASGAVAIFGGDPNTHIYGGNGGAGALRGPPLGPCAMDGLSAPALFVSAGAQVLWSGVSIRGGSYHVNCGAQYAATVAGPGAVVQNSPTDPTLDLIGVPSNGNTLSFIVRAPAGSRVILNFGRNATVKADPAAMIEQLTTKETFRELGIVPASGIVQSSLTVPATSLRGDFLCAQAEITLPSGARKRTNSLPMIVR